LGYGAIGKAFVEILLKQYPEAQIVAVDTYDLGYKENRFQYINNPVNKDNIKDLFKTMGL
jgi:homospermidine synthase